MQSVQAGLEAQVAQDNLGTVSPIPGPANEKRLAAGQPYSLQDLAESGSQAGEASFEEPRFVGFASLHAAQASADAERAPGVSVIEQAKRTIQGFHDLS